MLFTFGAFLFFAPPVFDLDLFHFKHIALAQRRASADPTASIRVASMRFRSFVCGYDRLELSFILHHRLSVHPDGCIYHGALLGSTLA